MVVAFFRYITIWSGTAITILWTYRIIVISLSVMYLAFWQMDQGMDLLVNLNDGDTGIIVFYISISILAALHWHLAKYLSYNVAENNEPVDYKQRSLKEIVRIVFRGKLRYGNAIDSYIARMLGVLTLLIPGFGVLHVLDAYGMSDLPAGGLLAGVSVFYALLFRLSFFEKTSKSAHWRIAFLVVILAIFATIGAFRWLNRGRPEDLVFLWVGVLLLSLAFVIVVSIRREITNKVVQDKSVAPYVMVPSLWLAFLFIILNFQPHMLAAVSGYGQFSSVWVLISALTFYVLFFFSMSLLGRKTSINVNGLLVTFAFASAYFIDNTFHDIHMIQKEEVKIPSMENYFAGWLKSREKEIFEYDSLGKKYPVFLVNAYGGGIRAAAFTSFTLAHLDANIRSGTKGDKTFQHFVFAYSGASGGTIGAAVMCTLHPDSLPIGQKIFDFYRRDFLSPVLVGLTGRDFMYSTFGSFTSIFGNVRDRSRLQDSVWTFHLNEQFHSEAFSGDFRWPWKDSTYQVPLLFANTYHVEKGEKGILAPVMLNPRSFPTAMVVSNQLDTISLQFSTAAFLSARFPFISPAGEMDPEHHFMDGGLKENSGAETSREIGLVLEAQLRDDSTLTRFRNKIQIEFLSLKNTTDSVQQKPAKNMFQLTAPVLALAMNWEGNTRRADALNELRYPGHYARLTPSPYIGGEKKVVFPLGWQISSAALKRLKASLVEDKNPGVVNYVKEKIIPKPK